MTDIRQLDAATVDRIAAGEVVERPASAVKELVENSIDADASRVTVAVKDGGREGIVVRDDGEGMTTEEVRMAVKQHTTSKIRSIEDLESGVGTLGFRGEALHAIGSVAKVTVTTRERGADTGTELRMEGGEVVSLEPAGCPEGTRIDIEDLFYNVPARRKYLKQASTEFSHINSIVTGYALANPDAAVTLEHEGRETFATTGQGDLRSAVMAVYGREVAANMIQVDFDGDGVLDGISGLVSHPETNRAGREYMNTFVNGRYVTARAVREAVVDAYGGQLAPDRFPFAVLDLSLDPGTVDVNVHPRKLEVRFADEDRVKEQVTDAVESALLDEGLIRTSAPRGRSQAAQTEISPERADSASGSDSPTASTDTASERRESHSVDTRSRDSGTNIESTPRTQERAPERSREVTETTSDTPEEPASEGTTDSHAPNWARESERKFRTEPEQATLTDEAPGPEYDRLPAMRVLGQLHDTYIVAETDDGLVLIDQHAADERVNYERLRATFRDGVTTQALAEPVTLSLTAGEAELFRACGEALSRLGFTAALADDRTVRVSTVPALLADAAGPELIRDLVGDFADGDPGDTVEAHADDLLGDLACYPSIKGNTSLTEGSVVDLLSALDSCENPYACPHGRPVVIELARGELEDRFERDYPGHSGRRPE